MTKTAHSPEVIELLRQYDSPTVSNAVERFTVRDPVDGYANMELRCQFPQYEPMVGYAITCTADSTTRDDKRESRLADFLDAIQAAPKPAVLVIQNIGSDRLRSCFVGDMICTAAQKIGVVGVVTDGGYRDKDGIAQRTPGMQVFSPGLVVSHGHAIFIDLEVTVSVCGLTIRNGDLLHGDSSGLLSIPHQIAADVPQEAEKIRRGEAEFFNFFDNKEFNYEQMKRLLAPH